ncbi:MAG: hypothetical protein HY077_06845 [Elusimicrobia bacterium]|nr:hypothetical protein [Elusimicrobiota bacterium]
MIMRLSMLAMLLLLPASSFAEKYELKDAGDFMPPLGSQNRIEFADKYGWRNYSVDFDFGLDQGGRTLSRESKLTVHIVKRDGKTWSYTCKAKGSQPLMANVNFLYNKGISVVAECRIPEKDFAKAVGLDPQDVGLPSLVFQAMIQDGEVKVGAQRGLYFIPGGQIESSELNAYAANNEDPTALAVVFRSN